MHKRSAASDDPTIGIFSDSGDRTQKKLAFDTRAAERGGWRHRRAGLRTIIITLVNKYWVEMAKAPRRVAPTKTF
ncbi:hypothetical protein [Microcoleus sp. bin38.metabat.b11b12b14.051]|uniref:hypothetical protein n=1 Tax=Microcoleus sp. bin38.metabat.b11b12b14.051 TaxID=2742709 RepID=UPI0025DD7A06|nr:hypothetical protein [Microcoleus sp. bin38.metabat.b11b12b14.051]